MQQLLVQTCHFSIETVVTELASPGTTAQSIQATTGKDLLSAGNEVRSETQLPGNSLNVQNGEKERGGGRGRKKKVRGGGVRLRKQGGGPSGNFFQIRKECGRGRG